MFKRIYFVVAPNFHGATLLSRLMDGHPEVISLGDTYPSNRVDQICGCGQYVSRCAFWQEVAERVGAERYREYPHLLPDYPPIFGPRWDRVLYNTLSPRLLKRLIPYVARQQFAHDFEVFTAAVHEGLGKPDAGVYVDGVKSISRLYALISAGVRIDGVIHLYRDPGDYIKSTMKQNGVSWRIVLRRMISWRLFHNRARRIGSEIPSINLTYEGLAERPDESLRELFDFVGLAPMGVTELAEHRKGHVWHFMGNASLFGFDGTISASRHQLSTGERCMVRLLAGPYREEAIHLSAGHR